jgi:hypothetical protein
MAKCSPFAKTRLVADELKKLQGAFAFVVYDQKNQRIVAARDSEGNEPMYWGTCKDGSGLIFSTDRLVSWAPAPSPAVRHLCPPGFSPSLSPSLPGSFKPPAGRSLTRRTCSHGLHPSHGSLSDSSSLTFPPIISPSPVPHAPHRATHRVVCRRLSPPPTRVSAHR